MQKEIIFIVLFAVLALGFLHVVQRQSNTMAEHFDNHDGKDSSHTCAVECNCKRRKEIVALLSEILKKKEDVENFVEEFKSFGDNDVKKNVVIAFSNSEVELRDKVTSMQNGELSTFNQALLKKCEKELDEMGDTLRSKEELKQFVQAQLDAAAASDKVSISNLISLSIS